MFEYHTFLHHSQTYTPHLYPAASFEYHTFLHHSQTAFKELDVDYLFEYHTFLHHSQTWEDVILLLLQV